MKEKHLVADISPALTLAAEVIIELSIALKNIYIYDKNHKIVIKSIERAYNRIKNALNLKYVLKYHFAKNTIIYEQIYLDKKNPIFTRFANNLWEISITSLEFREGLNVEELLDFLSFVKNLKSSKDNKNINVSFRNIIIEFLDINLLKVEKKEEITEEDKKIAEKLWEEFLFTISKDDKEMVETRSVSQSVVYLAKKLSEQAKEKEKDYGSAVVDYLKKLDSSYRRKGILSQTELGNKIKAFIETMDPALRQQILVSCLTTEELSENILQELIRISNIDLIMDALSKLNSESRAIPLTVYRTMTLLSMLEGESQSSKEDEDFFIQEISGEKLQALLDTLLSEDQRFEYTSEEYEEKIEKFQEYSDEMAREKSYSSAKSLFSPTNINLHFMGVALEVLERCKSDTNLAECTVHKLNDIFMSFFSTNQYGGCLKCISLKKRAEELDPKVSALNFVWEEEEKIFFFIQLLKSEDRSEAIVASKILSQIGRKALAPLVEVLRNSNRMDHRIHALNAIIEMEYNPAPFLLDLLDKPQPWYLIRNIVYILKKRKDPLGIEKLKNLWHFSHIKVKMEFISYLYNLKNKDWITYFKDAIFSPIEEMVINAARLITKIKWDEVVQLVIERANLVPPHKIGGNFHKQLLYFLVKSGNKKAINYVSCLPINVRTFFPWQKNSLKNYITDLLKDYHK